MKPLFRDVLKENFVHWLILVNAVVPMLMLEWDAAAGRLGANIENKLLRTTGTMALIFLMITLMITPAVRIFSAGYLIPFRRTCGLISFAYATLHLMIYVGVDRAGNLRDAFKELTMRTYLQFGFAAWVLLLLLAITSFDWIIRRMGTRWWKRLHSSIYVLSIFAVIHYFLLVKADTTRPIAFAAVLAALLGVRVVYWAADGSKLQTREAKPRRSTNAPHSARLVPDNTSFDVRAKETLLEASERAGVDIPFRCRKGICGKCKVKKIEGSIHMQVDRALSVDDRDNGYILACQSYCDGPIVFSKT